MDVKISTIAFCVLACIYGTLGNTKIVGGSEAAVGQFPYQVSLRKGSNHICGASILDETTLLCAAHCVYGAITLFHKVVVGTNSIKDGGDSYIILKFIPHKEYNSAKMINDIAIIKLREPIMYKKNIQPIKLPTKDTSEGDICTLSGWGSTSFPGVAPTKLQFVQLQTISNTECGKKQTTLPIHEEQVCTFTKYGEGVCHGDSGGPLVNEAGQQIGIVSWGTPCAHGEPDVFTRVHSYLDWIAEKRI